MYSLTTAVYKLSKNQSPRKRAVIGDKKMKFSKMNLSDLIDFKPDSIDCDVEDGLLKEIRLISGDRLVKIKCDYSQLIVSEKSPPSYKEIHTITALDEYGSSIFREFVSKDEAEEFARNTNYTNIKIETRMEKVD